MGGSKLRLQVISRDLSLAIGERDYQSEIEARKTDGEIETNARVNAWAETIAKRLAQEAVKAYPFSEDWNWELHVIKDSSANANCRPGGKMILNTGMLALTRLDKDKIAAVLGHEIAHALLEHGRSRFGRRAIALGTLEALGESFKMGGQRFQVVANSLRTVTLPLDRNHEREADLLGLQLMARAGFDPVRGASIWNDMKGDEPVPELVQRLAPYLFEHPTGDERLATLTEAARRLAESAPKR